MSARRGSGTALLLAWATLGCQGAGAGQAPPPPPRLEAVSGSAPASERYLLIRESGLHTALVRVEASSQGPVGVWVDAQLLGVVPPRTTFVRDFSVPPGRAVAFKIFPGASPDLKLVYSYAILRWNEPSALEDLSIEGTPRESEWLLDLGMGSYALSIETAKDFQGTLRIGGPVPFARTYPAGQGLPHEAFQVAFGRTVKVGLHWGAPPEQHCAYRLRLIRTQG